MIRTITLVKDISVYFYIKLLSAIFYYSNIHKYRAKKEPESKNHIGRQVINVKLTKIVTLPYIF